MTLRNKVPEAEIGYLLLLLLPADYYGTNFCSSRNRLNVTINVDHKINRRINVLLPVECVNCHCFFQQ